MHDFLQRAADHLFLLVKHTNSRCPGLWFVGWRSMMAGIEMTISHGQL